MQISGEVFSSDFLHFLNQHAKPKHYSRLRPEIRGLRRASPRNSLPYLRRLVVKSSPCFRAVFLLVMDLSMKRFFKFLLGFRGVERVLVRVLRPVRKVPGFASVWQRLKWALCAQAQGRDAALRWVQLTPAAGLYIHLGELVGAIYFEPAGYEPVTTEFVKGTLKPGQTFIDIGANYGYFSMLAAGLVGATGKVVAFEANPVLQDMERRSSERNGFQERFIPAEVALSDTNQENVVFYVSTDPHQMGISTMHPWQEHLKAGNLSEQNTISVRTVRFDDWVATAGITAVDMIKLDVEGAELQVLRGMTESLKRFAPGYIIVETAMEGEVTDFLKAAGYEASPLELHSPEAQWGNILFKRMGGGKRGLHH